MKTLTVNDGARGVVPRIEDAHVEGACNEDTRPFSGAPRRPLAVQRRRIPKIDGDGA